MKSVVLFLCLLCCTTASAQELFPHNEPASTMPKHVLGVRTFAESYKEVKEYKNLFALRLMYGLTPKLTVMATATATNHHDTLLPPDFASHEHVGNQTIFKTGEQVRGAKYPYRFVGVHLFAKYRFYTADDVNRHFRMAAYGEWSYLKNAHDEAEPNLMDDTRGWGAGLIGTYLRKHFAVSLTTGIIMPNDFIGYMKDPYGGVFPNTPTRIKYGKALKYNLSFGYLLHPASYKSYSETNWNLYLELMGKYYGGATIYQADKDGSYEILPTSPALVTGNYLEAHPGVQCIIKSNLRIDFAVGFPVLNRSFARAYPLYMIGLQRYFY